MINRILITIPCLCIGGTETQTLNLAKTLCSLGNKITVLCQFEFNGNVVSEFESAGATVILLRWKRDINVLSFINKLRIEIHNLEPDIVHVQYMAPGALPIIAARLAGVKTIFATVHQPWTRSHRRFSKIILRAASLLCTRFIAVSVNAEESWFGKGELYDENKLTKHNPHHFTIHNSIDVGDIRKITTTVNADNLKKNLSIPPGIPVIGALARLKYEKGIDLLLEAFMLLLKSGIKTHLFLIGTGPDELKLKEIVKAQNICTSVTFYGEADRVRAMQLISVIDILVVPSRYEGFGLSAAEAMAGGKPVIAADCYGLKEVVADKKTGLTFKTGDISELKEKLQVLLKNDTLCKEYGLSGQKRAEELFDIPVFQNKIAALYNN